MSSPKGRDLLDLPDSEISTWLDSIDTVLFDCDGVLWLYDEPIEGSPETVKKFQDIGKQVFFVTNNATKTREQYAEKSKKLNYNVEKENILGSAYLTARYLKDIDFKKKVYLMGPKAVKKELEIEGIQSIGVGPDTLDPKITIGDFIQKHYKRDPDVGAVVIGFDKHISFPKMLRATAYLDDPKCLFIGTNLDTRFPILNIIIPGCGSMLKSIETSSGRQATTMGKPSKIVRDILIHKFNVNPKRTLMVGDRCSTDILLGTQCGFQTLLCETGYNKMADVDKWARGNNAEDKLLIPNFIVPRLGCILKYLK